MGFPVQSTSEFDDLIAKSNKDWCMVLLMDLENLTEAGRQMSKLLTQFDEDSGQNFDFFLPGYYASGGAFGRTRGWVRNWRHGWLFQRLGTHIAIDRVGTLDFVREDFRKFYKEIERRCGCENWHYNGRCELLIFKRSRRIGSFHGLIPGSAGICVLPGRVNRGRYEGGAGITYEETMCYDLDDITRNGGLINEFLLNLCYRLRGNSDCWRDVKRAIDEVYAELIMPPPRVMCNSSQARLLDIGARGMLSARYAKDGFIFISYSTKNFGTADILRRDLEARGLVCWMAPSGIPSGTSYAYIIETAISRCGMFVLLLSNESLNSVWVEKEFLMAQSIMGNRKSIFVAWCAEPVSLDATGFRYSLVNIQIDSAPSAAKIAASYLGQGLYGDITVPVESWVRAIEESHGEVSNFAVACPWKEFSGLHWSRVLTVNPDCDRYLDCEKLTSDDWSALLKDCPSYADRCPWGTVAEDFAWGMVRKNRELIKYFPFEKSSTQMRIRLLLSCPEYADQCRLGEIGGSLSVPDWKRLLLAQSSLKPYCVRCGRWDDLPVGIQNRVDRNFENRIVDEGDLICSKESKDADL